MEKVTFVLVTLLLIGLHVHGQPNTQSVKATWIPASSLNTNPQEAQQTMQGLAAAGINRVYICVWNQGLTYFNSSTMMQLVGSSGLGPDQLSWGIQAAKQNGLQVFAWFEYGFMSAYQTPDNAFAQVAQNMGWQIGVANNFVWLDPTNSVVVNFLGNIIADAVNGYPELDGVQLDDHFAYPVSLGGNNLQAMTDAAVTVRSIVRAISSITLSLSPAPYSSSVPNLNVDWVDWSNKGLFTEYVPQLYVTTNSDFQSDLSDTLSAAPSSLDTSLIIGLRCDGSGDSTLWSELEPMIDETAQNQLGVSIWYANGILNTYNQQFIAKWG